MSTRAVLVRVLLATALLLNGIGGAVAGTRMHLTETETSTPAASHGSSEAMPCHGGQKTDGDDAPAQNHTEHSAAESGAEETAPDCCQGACTCACMAATYAMQPGLGMPALAWARTAALGVLQVGHPAPAVPHLIRPPIG